MRVWTEIAALLSLAAAAVSPAAAQDAPAGTDPFRGYDVVDLTHRLEPGIPVYPGNDPFRLETVTPIERGFLSNRFCSGEHVGTHVDSPAHFHRGGRTVAELPLEALRGPAVVIDFTERAKADPDAALSEADLLAWEAAHGRIPDGAFVLVRTGWEDRWADPASYLNRDAAGVLHSPGVSEPAALFLALKRDVRGVGIDTLSADCGNSRDFPEHHVLLSRGKVNVENLANLRPLPATGAYLLVSPLPLAGGSGSPARVLAFVPKGR